MRSTNNRSWGFAANLNILLKQYIPIRSRPVMNTEYKCFGKVTISIDLSFVQGVLTYRPIVFLKANNRYT